MIDPWLQMRWHLAGELQRIQRRRLVMIHVGLGAALLQRLDTLLTRECLTARDINLGEVVLLNFEFPRLRLGRVRLRPLLLGHKYAALRAVHIKVLCFHCLCLISRGPEDAVMGKVVSWQGIHLG